MNDSSSLYLSNSPRRLYPNESTTTTTATTSHIATNDTNPLQVPSNAVPVSLQQSPTKSSGKLTHFDVKGKIPNKKEQSSDYNSKSVPIEYITKPHKATVPPIYQNYSNALLRGIHSAPAYNSNNGINKLHQIRLNPLRKLKDGVNIDTLHSPTSSARLTDSTGFRNPLEYYDNGVDEYQNVTDIDVAGHNSDPLEINSHRERTSNNPYNHNLLKPSHRIIRPTSANKMKRDIDGVAYDREKHRINNKALRPHSSKPIAAVIYYNNLTAKNINNLQTQSTDVFQFQEPASIPTVNISNESGLNNNIEKSNDWSQHKQDDKIISQIQSVVLTHKRRGYTASSLSKNKSGNSLLNSLPEDSDMFAPSTSTLETNHKLNKKHGGGGVHPNRASYLSLKTQIDPSKINFLNKTTSRSKSNNTLGTASSFDNDNNLFSDKFNLSSKFDFRNIPVEEDVEVVLNTNINTNANSSQKQQDIVEYNASQKSVRSQTS